MVDRVNQLIWVGSASLESLGEVFGQEINLSVPFSSKFPSVTWAKMFTQGVMHGLIYLMSVPGPPSPWSLLMEEEGPEGPSKQTHLSNLSWTQA